jgi:hypothetical protein
VYQGNLGLLLDASEQLLALFWWWIRGVAKPVVVLLHALAAFCSDVLDCLHFSYLPLLVDVKALLGHEEKDDGEEDNMHEVALLVGDEGLDDARAYVSGHSNYYM